MMSDFRAQLETELLGGLNEVQRAAVTHDRGPLLIVAGAGSGKTRVITHRIAYLCRIKNVAPYRIVAVTFTNKAAEEMRHRLETLMGPMARDVYVRTFHSLGLYLLTRNAQAAGFKSNFSIYDSAAQTSLLKSILKDFKIDSQQIAPGYAADLINKARDSLIAPEKYVAEGFYAEELSRIYREYIKRLRANNALDFGDLLYESVRLLLRNDEVRERYQTLWRYLMIDEYQDTNFAQYKLGQLIAAEHRNIAVVGDDDQSIYSWRGADVSNILNFEKDHQGCRVLKLEENYRSTAPILHAAAAVIAHNEKRLNKTIYTTRDGGEPLRFTMYDNEYAEAEAIVSRIRSLRRQGRSLADMAVFYRTNAQSRVFEQLLLEQNLPFVLVGSFRFFERKEIKDILAYLAVIVNPADSISLERIINVPGRGVGDTSVERLQAFAAAEGISLLEAMGRASEIPRMRPASTLKALQRLFSEWQAMHTAGESPARIVEDLLDRSGYLSSLKKEHSPEAASRLDNISQFVDAIMEYEEQFSAPVLAADGPVVEDGGPVVAADAPVVEDEGQNPTHPNLEDYLQKLALFTSDTETGVNRPTDDPLLLMTLHNAKGLEFPTVFLTGMEEGYLPHSLSIEDGNIEEERRLLYVGITRAKEDLFLSACRSRRIFGSFQPRRVSRFLDEIPPEDLLRDGSGSAISGTPRAGDARQAGARTRPNDAFTQTLSYSVGERVEHRKYGLGVISAVEETVAGQKVSVHFGPDEGTKHFLTRYTPMRKLGY